MSFFSRRLGSLLLRSALFAGGLCVLGGLALATIEAVEQGYLGWSTHLFFRLTAYGAYFGALLGSVVAAAVVLQLLLLRLLLRSPLRAVVALWAGWLTALLATAASPKILARLVADTPVAKLPLFAGDAASMTTFVTRIIAGGLVPERIARLALDFPPLMLVPLLPPLVLGLIVYLLLHWPLRRFFAADEAPRVHLGRWIVWTLAVALAAAGPPLLADATRPDTANLPNLVLISIDTLRTDVMGAYGAKVSATPNIDELAAAGTSLAQVRAPASWTLPSHAAMLTGRWPWRLGVRRVADALPAEARTLAERLAARGYETHAVVTHLFVDSPYGMGQGFDRVEHPTTERAADAIKATLHWLAARSGDRPYFLFLHLYDPHWPYDPQGQIPSLLLGDSSLADRVRVQDYANFIDLAKALRKLPPRFTDAARALYLGEVYGADRAVGQLRDFLRGRDENTFFALVSDHGELFGEREMYGHGITLQPPEIEVPWIVAGPGVPAGRMLNGPAGLIDVTPTLLSLLGVNDGAWPTDGLDLTAAIRDEQELPTRRWVGGENTFIGETPARYVADERWYWFGGVKETVRGLEVDVPAFLLEQGTGDNIVAGELIEELMPQIEAIVEDLFAGAGRSTRNVTLDEAQKKKLSELGYVQ